MLFVIECYTMADKLYYNIHAEDRFQELEEEQFYAAPPRQKRKRY